MHSHKLFCVCAHTHTHTFRRSCLITHIHKRYHQVLKDLRCHDLWPDYKRRSPIVTEVGTTSKDFTSIEPRQPHTLFSFPQPLQVVFFVFFTFTREVQTVFTNSHSVGFFVNGFWKATHSFGGVGLWESWTREKKNSIPWITMYWKMKS